MSFSTPKPPKVPDPTPAPTSFGDPSVYTVGKFLRLQGKNAGYAATIRGGKAIGKSGAPAPVISPSLIGYAGG